MMRAVSVSGPMRSASVAGATVCVRTWAAAKPSPATASGTPITITAARRPGHAEAAAAVPSAAMAVSAAPSQSGGSSGSEK